MDMGLFAKQKRSREQKAYEAKLKEAQEAQRAGKIPLYAELMAEADALREAIPEG
jgi:hypothetical protein